ncbi:helix-turn-helix domain-containing protein [Bordetella genomosp. 11]|uniref:HTH cro/C1-type domain-containing protein n=1 Tax=Bordetella genomosp. 11 TaxID=1416808 RepID=A0A261UKC4_9BORD|nr:helix-turn-helix transcriptional regulator [Bordetella genomosp. 11]OZI61987.1 hypothetical protein CAL28_22405 [Bordetella genomosp. 11]
MLTSRLKEARLRAGLSQERLGTLAGLDEMSASSRMNQYERGKHTPGFFLIERLAQALRMPTPWFYTRDDDMAELLLAYNDLSPELKEEALSYLRDLARRDKKEADATDGEQGQAQDRAAHGPVPGAGSDGAGAAGDSNGQDGGTDGRPQGTRADAEAHRAADTPPDSTTYSRSSPGQNRNRIPARPPASDERSRK